MKKVRTRVSLGFLVGLLAMPIYCFLVDSIAGEGTSIRVQPSQLWLKMLIGGFIGIPIFLLVWRDKGVRR